MHYLKQHLSSASIRLVSTLFFFVFTLFFATASLLANASEQVQDTLDEKSSTDAQHLGVASCASSTCHGSTVPFKESNVLQNEFRTWNELDPHARAYKTLLTNESKNIANNLGLKAAETADICLGCHADNVASSQQGADFNLSDGVGCEACHGGAENYLDSHTSATHEQNLNAGLVATENPTIRAKLCVSCHVGNDSDRKITHTIMGAGHPRMSFELNTFSSIQPAHYSLDEDYTARKGDHSELQIWAIGQLVTSEQMLTNIQKFPRSGLFPELIHMDCLGCHQAMSKVDWAKNPLTKLPAGALRYNDAHLMMSYRLAKIVSPDLARDVLSDTKEFLNNGVVAQHGHGLAGKLLENIKSVRVSLEKAPLTSTQGNAVLAALIEHGLSASHQGYAAAEQSAMAINSVLRVMNSNDMNSQGSESILQGVDTMFKGVNDAERYRQDVFVAGLKKIQSAVK